MKAKINFLFILVFGPVAALFAQSLTWSNEQVVANGNPYGNTRPRIAVASGNVPVVIWGGGMTTQPLYTARKSGTTFSMAMPVTPNGVDPAIMTWHGPDIAADANIVFIVFKREMEMMYNIYCIKSTDGGLTWGDTVRVDGMNGPYSRFPAVDVTSSGNPAVLFMAFDSAWGSATYVVTNSIDGGMTFQLPVDVSAAGGSYVCDCCPGYIEVEGNNQAAAWRRNNNNLRDMWANVSVNDGVSFSSAMDVDNTDWMITSCPSSGPDPYLWNDSLFTVFMSQATGNSRVYLNTSNYNTLQSGSTTMLHPSVPSSTLQNYPFIAGSADTIVVVWQQTSGGNTDVWYSWSVTGAAGLFSNAAILNSATSGSQQNPHVAYSNGVFHFVFSDMNSGNVIYKSATISPTGIEMVDEKLHVKVYPNPSDESILLHVPAGKAFSIKLSDMTGRTIETFQTSGERQVILHHQVAGVYFLEVTGENHEVFTTRVVFY